jgi:hypothetical protein
MNTLIASILYVGKYARMMEFHKELGRGAAKEGGGAWTQSMHLLYTPHTKKILLKTPC